MKETIIIIPTTSELAKTLAYHNKPLFNTRVMTPIDFARESLMRSGKICTKKFLSKSEELIVYNKIIKNVDYFKTVKLSDLKNINSTINNIRSLVITEKLETIKENFQKGIFKEKNEALVKLLELYLSELDRNNQVDTIGLIKYAILNAKPVCSKVVKLKEVEYMPIELKLIEALSENNKEASLLELFDIKGKHIHVNSYKNAYGSSNEVGIILDDIITKDKQDTSIIACADYPTYSQIFYDFSTKYNIEISFGNGLSIDNTFPGKLLQRYYRWMGLGNFGWQPFFNLIYSPYFNFELLSSLVKYDDEKIFNVSEFWKRVSRLRLTNDKNTNDIIVANFEKAIQRNINENYKLRKYVEGIKIIADELALPIEDFIVKYCISRRGFDLNKSLDDCAITKITEEIKSIKAAELEITNDVIESLLKKTVYRQGAKPGHLLATSIDNAIYSLKENLYICGMSATTYPGSVKENPLLLDEDLKLFNNEILTSEGQIKAKQTSFFNLVELASSLNNEINISYPGLNVSELKNNNASSLLFELYKKEYGNKELKDFTKSVIKTEYFEPNLSNSKNVGKAYNEGKSIENKPNLLINDEVSVVDIGKYSPSAINNFFKCKKLFLYQNLLGIKMPDDYKPYEVIAATEQGTLVHSLMEYLVEQKLIYKENGKEEFLEYTSNCFDEYMCISVPLIKEKIDDVKKQFLEMMENGFDFDYKLRDSRTLMFKEEDNEVLHEESGVNIHGFPDRVEEDQNGNAVILDFKTEKDLFSHKKDDVNTCLQVLIYAYIVEKTKGKKVDHTEYRMLRHANGVVTCKYDDEIKEQLTEKLKEFKAAIDSGDFSIPEMTEKEEKERCMYCKYGSICGKVVKASEEE